MVELETLKMLVEAGGIGIALVTLWLLYKKDQSTNKLIGNHLNSETKAKLKQAVALQKLASAIKHYFNNAKK